MAFTEDLSVFFDTDDFAVEAIFNLTPSGTRTVNVIFNTPSQEVRIYDQTIESDAPFLTCRTSDLATIPNRGTVTIDAVAYTIGKIVHDGTGVSTVYLN